MKKKSRKFNEFFNKQIKNEKKKNMNYLYEIYEQKINENELEQI